MLIKIAETFFIGFWLGVLTKENLHSIDQAHYAGWFCNKEINMKGLFDWEVEVINNYFQSCNSLLVAGAGGGREVLALRKLGYDADGFECNLNLVEFANKLLNEEGATLNIKLANRDDCPIFQKQFDGIIVGWGVYMHIQGKQQRITFLKKLRAQVKDKSPILLSFFTRESNRRHMLIASVGNIIRRPLGREILEVGDDLVDDLYEHFFIQEEIAGELHAAGFELQLFSQPRLSNAYAVGIAS